MVVIKPDKWKQERHDVIDEFVDKIREEAHRDMDRILDSSFITNDSYIIGDSSLVLPLTVMEIVCHNWKDGPKSKQTEWKNELEIVRRALK